MISGNCRTFAGSGGGRSSERRVVTRRFCHALGALPSSPMSTGRVSESFAPIGSNLAGFDNYFCRECRHIVHVRKGSVGFRACPTQGMHVADRVRGVRDDAEVKNRRSHSYGVATSSALHLEKLLRS